MENDNTKSPSLFMKASVGVLVAALAIVGSAQAALAQAFDPEAEVTTLAGTAVNTMGPIVIALATAVIGLAILAWALRKVFRLIRSGGSSV